MSTFLVNTSGVSGIALSGFDPVAFFTDSKPVNGSPSIKSEYEGAIYFFVSEDHKKTFDANPAKYAPQFGGYCAFGVSVDALFPVDVTTAQIYKDKLYVNLNPDIAAMFENDKDSGVAKANANWPGLVKSHVK
jgi:YHS domain-containing protein